ncbi:hypothetical protein [Gordonia rhizosphera]|nr:hypothetical protein [Gordonia rhizosphera]
MLRTAPLKAIILGAAISGLTVVGAGAATADTDMSRSGDGTTISATATTTGTDYGRGTTRSDNSPGTAGGLS